MCIRDRIRPFAVGRKNWLFSDSVSGANASAVVYTMVEMAKAHDLNAVSYTHLDVYKRQMYASAVKITSNKVNTSIVFMITTPPRHPDINSMSFCTRGNRKSHPTLSLFDYEGIITDCEAHLNYKL